jgi:hypothetical protein
MGISSNKRPRKPSFKDEEIDVAELAGMSNMKGMLSFLDTKPEDYARMLAPPPGVPNSPPQADVELGKPSRSLPRRSLLSSSRIHGSNELPGSSFLPPLAGPEKNGRPIPSRHPRELQRISSFIPGSDLPIVGGPTISERIAASHSNQQPDSSLLPDSDLRSSDIGEPDSVAPLSDQSSTLLPGGDLRTPNGRTVRLRLARSVQDAHTHGEHLLLTAMWKKGSPESDDTRLLRAGLAELSRWTGSHKTSCRAYIRALIAKLALEEAETFNASAGSDGARVYRIFSFNTILERRRRANLTHVIRTGAVSFVDPRTGQRLPPGSNLLSGSSLLADSKIQPASNLPSDSGSNHPLIPGSNQPLLYKNKEDALKQTTATTAVYEALCAYGSVDAAALSRLILKCKEQVTDCTEQEIVHFIHEKGTLVKARDTRIQNPIGFLIDAVPKCFAGETFPLYRQAQTRPAAAEDPNQGDRDREWGREHEADLLDPSVPEEVKQVIRRCLGML